LVNTKRLRSNCPVRKVCSPRELEAEVWQDSLLPEPTAWSRVMVGKSSDGEDASGKHIARHVDAPRYLLAPRI
jgi:hypothetical protein